MLCGLLVRAGSRQGRGGARGGGAPRQGLGPDWGGPHGRSACRDRPGLRGHLAPPPPPPGILSYLNYMGMWAKGRPPWNGGDELPPWASLQNTRKSLSLSEPAVGTCTGPSTTRTLSAKSLPSAPHHRQPRPSLLSQLHPSSVTLMPSPWPSHPACSPPCPDPEVRRCPPPRSRAARGPAPSLVRPRPQVPSFPGGGLKPHAIIGIPTSEGQHRPRTSSLGPPDRHDTAQPWMSPRSTEQALLPGGVACNYIYCPSRSWLSSH